jgi:anthranilate phosphoribosyltransferase
MLIQDLNTAAATPLAPHIDRLAGVGVSISRLCVGQSLAETEAELLFTALVNGQLGEAEIAALLVGLRLKGETLPELIGAARALRAADREFERPNYLFADCCGTGGDESGSINVSTATAFVAAAAGLPIVKHGNRSFTSRCGSADVLESLGAQIELSPERSRRLLDETKICFLFAPSYHPGLRHAGPVRRALGVRTVMNLLGPCLNPAEPPVQLLGVADPSMLEPVALTLASLGVEKALVVHGSGLDEVALHGQTTAVRLADGKIDTLVIGPEDAGLERAPLEAVRGGNVSENAQQLVRLLAGNASEAETNLIAINTGALLMTAGLATDLRDGTAQALEAIGSGAAATTLEQFVEASRA